jgi:hypothetical protein
MFIEGKEFLLTGANDAVTRTLEFIYTVQPNDKTNADFYINSKDDIVFKTAVVVMNPFKVKQNVFSISIHWVYGII